MLGCFLSGFAVSGFGGEPLLGSDRLRVEHRSEAGDPGTLDETARQQIAQQMGCGHFFVQAAVIGEGGGSADDTRVFYVYSTMEAVRNGTVQQQILFRRTRSATLVIAGEPDEMVRGFLASAQVRANDSAFAIRLLPAVIPAVLYEGRGQLLSNEGRGLSAQSLDRRDGGLSVRSGGLRDLSRRPVISHDSAGRLVWQDRFVRGDGGIEEVRVIVPDKPEERVIMERLVLRPAGYCGTGIGTSLPVEEWVVVKEAGWKPPQRYKLLLMLAALGNAEKQFQLGTALLQETDDAAKTEGFKWLEAAAAQGHRAATDLLTQSREQLVRPDRDRDKVRVSRCCPVPGH